MKIDINKLSPSERGAYDLGREEAFKRAADVCKATALSLDDEMLAAVASGLSGAFEKEAGAGSVRRSAHASARGDQDGRGWSSARRSRRRAQALAGLDDRARRHRARRRHRGRRQGQDGQDIQLRVRRARADLHLHRSHGRRRVAGELHRQDQAGRVGRLARRYRRGTDRARRSPSTPGRGTRLSHSRDRHDERHRRADLGVDHRQRPQRCRLNRGGRGRLRQGLHQGARAGVDHAPHPLRPGQQARDELDHYLAHRRQDGRGPLRRLL